MSKSAFHAQARQPEDPEILDISMRCFYCESRTLYRHVPSNKPLCGACMTLGAGAGRRTPVDAGAGRGLDDTAR